jgi:hypothetical protein
MTKTFTVQIEAFRDKTKAQMKAVLSESVQDTITMAQLPVAQGGRMPVQTGNLRNSLVSELNGAALGEGEGSYALVADGMEPGDTARFSWTAAYAMRQEHGFVGEDSLGRKYNQVGKHFVEGAAEAWSKTVENNVRRLK